jgi:hypothetical protein
MYWIQQRRPNASRNAIKETGLSFTTDAVLAWPTKTSEVRLFELDNDTTSQDRLAREVWDYECYAGHRSGKAPAAPKAARSRSGSATATATPAPNGSHCSWWLRASRGARTSAGARLFQYVCVTIAPGPGIR